MGREEAMTASQAIGRVLLLMTAAPVWAAQQEPLSGRCAFATSAFMTRALDGARENRDAIFSRARNQLAQLAADLKTDMESSVAAQEIAQSRERQPLSQADRHGYLVAYEIGDHAVNRGALTHADYQALKQRIDALIRSVDDGRKTGVFSTSEPRDIERLLETMDTLDRIRRDEKSREKFKIACVIGSAVVGFVTPIGFYPFMGDAEIRLNRSLVAEAKKTMIGSKERHLDFIKKALKEAQSWGYERLTDAKIEALLKKELVYMEEQARSGNTPQFGSVERQYDTLRLVETKDVSEYSYLRSSAPSDDEVLRWSRRLAFREPTEINNDILRSEYASYRDGLKDRDGLFPAKDHPGWVFTPDDLKKKGEVASSMVDKALAAVGEGVAGGMGGIVLGVRYCERLGGKLVPPSGLEKPDMPGPLSRLRDIVHEVNNGNPSKGFAKQHYSVITVMATGEHLAMILTIDRTGKTQMTLTAIDAKSDISYFKEDVPRVTLADPNKETKEKPAEPKPLPPHDAYGDLINLKQQLIRRYFAMKIRDEDLIHVSRVFREAQGLYFTREELSDFKAACDQIGPDESEEAIVARLDRVLIRIRGERQKPKKAP